MTEKPAKTFLSHLKGDLSGALSAAIITLPMSIGYGILAFASLGTTFAPQAAILGVYAAVFAGFVAAMFGGTTIQITGPKAPLTLALSTLVAGLVANPAVPSFPVIIVGLASLCVLFAGFFQIMFGALGLSNLVKYIPQPVVSGFMNGIALLLIIKQLGPLLGLDVQTPLSAVFRDPGLINPLAVVVGLVTIISIFMAMRYLKRIPSSLTALIVGTSTFYLLSLFLGNSNPDQIIGELRLHLPTPTVLLDLQSQIHTLSVKTLLPEILFASLIISVLASMESMLSSVVCDNLTGTRHNSKRELIGQGIGNMVCSLFGSLAAAGSVPRSAANYMAGGRTRLSGMMCAVFILTMITLCGPLVSRIPIPVVAGIIFVVGLKLFDKWSLNLLKKISSSPSSHKVLLVDFCMTVAVALITICINLIVAVAIGMVIASVLFFTKIGRSVIKRIYYGDQFHSRRMRDTEQIEILEQNGREIVVLLLQGPVFFGSAEHLAEQIKSIMQPSRYLILDFKLVTDIDSTGTKILLQLKRRMEENGKKLFLSNLRSNPTVWQFLDIMDVAKALESENLFIDTDSALEFAENLLLAQNQYQLNENYDFEFSKISLFKGFTPSQLEEIRQKFRHKAYTKEEPVFKENENSRDLYLLIKGLMTVKIYHPERDRYKRLITYTPGTIFGEMSFLDGRPRSASLWAEEDAKTLYMSYDEFQILQDQHPELAFKLIQNIALEINNRLRGTSNQLRQIEDV